MPNSVSAATVTELLAALFTLLPIVILLIVYAALLALAYKYAANTAYAKAFFKASTPGAILMVINSGGVYLIVLAISAQYSSANGEQFAFNVAAATFGLALGWVLGIVISPSTKDEQSEFSLLTKAVSTFLSGYVLGYVKDITLDQVKHFLLVRQGVPFRLFIGTACCLSTIAVVFVSRRAEIMKANAVKDWFISYAPSDPRNAQGLRSDLLAMGPFASRDDALAQIELIKGRDEFQGLTLSAVHVEVGADATPPVASETTAGGGAAGGGGAASGAGAAAAGGAGAAAGAAGGGSAASGGATGGAATTGGAAGAAASGTTATPGTTGGTTGAGTGGAAAGDQTSGNTTSGSTATSSNDTSGTSTQGGTRDGWTGLNDNATTETTEQTAETNP